MSVSVAKRPWVGIGVFVIQDGQLLLGKRINAHGSNTWSSPGGHLEYGEDPSTCAARELFEETGLIAKNIAVGPWTNDVFEEEERHYITLFMLVAQHEGTVTVMEPEKCVEWKWFDFDKLPQPLFLPICNLLKHNNLNLLAPV